MPQAVGLFAPPPKPPAPTQPSQGSAAQSTSLLNAPSFQEQLSSAQQNAPTSKQSASRSTKSSSNSQTAKTSKKPKTGNSARKTSGDSSADETRTDGAESSASSEQAQVEATESTLKDPGKKPSKPATPTVKSAATEQPNLTANGVPAQPVLQRQSPQHHPAELSKPQDAAEAANRVEAVKTKQNEDDEEAAGDAEGKENEPSAEELAADTNANAGTAAATKQTVKSVRPAVSQAIGDRDLENTEKAASRKPAITALNSEVDSDADELQSIGPDVAGADSTDEKPQLKTSGSDFSAALSDAQSAATQESPAPQAASSSPATPPETRFALDNHEKIVTGVQTKLLPNGGSMQIRLDPAELGSMTINLHMRDGVMSATFETTSDHASQLLSHSLGQLKTALESQGMNVERLNVQQAPKGSGSHSSKDGEGHSDSGAQSREQQQEQQRKEMIKRMWKRLGGIQDPLDLVA